MHGSLNPHSIGIGVVGSTIISILLLSIGGMGEGWERGLGGEVSESRKGYMQELDHNGS